LCIEGSKTEPGAVIVTLFPELASIGGVQRAGRLTAAVLTSYASLHGEPCTFLSLNDPVRTDTFRIASQDISFTGFARSKRRFAAAAWRIASRRPRLVLALHPNLAPIVAAMKFRSPQTRSAIFAHGVDVWTPLNPLRRWSLRRSDLLLAPSEDTVSHLIEHQGVGRKKTRRLAWSLGPDFSAKSSPHIADRSLSGFPRGKIVLTVGRWSAEDAYKGVDHLIAAMPQLLRSVPDVHLVAVGEGNELPRLRQLARSSAASERIHFPPFMTQEKLDAAYASCDVFALPSRGEGFGLVFLEAMSHGKPVVGGAHGGTPDIIEDGVTGYLVQYGDVAVLGDRLRQLLTNDSFRLQMGAAARQRVLRDYTFDRFSSELASQLDGLLAASR
jgi:phosphatidylinositol alpha-1,6-mannosyltransferase